MKVPINQELINLIDDLDLDVDEAILFCLAVEYDLLSVLIEKELITEQNEHEFRINLTTMDDNGNIILKYSLFNFKESGQFAEYISKLKDAGLDINGFTFNMQDYSILTTDEETKKNFSTFVLKHPNFNLDKLVKITCEYYQKVSTAKALRKFLITDAETMYG